MKGKFEVELLPEAFTFIKKQDFKARKKIFQNLNRAKQSLDPKLFKKLNSEIWEFVHYTTGFNIGYWHFGIKKVKLKLLFLRLMDLKRKLTK